MNYLLIINDKGERVTSLVLGVHANTLEELHTTASVDYPNHFYVEDDGTMLLQSLEGKIYVNGQMVEPPPYVPTKGDKINSIKSEYEQRFKTLEEAQSRLLLMGKPTTAISTQYIALNSEMVARIKEVQ